MLHSRLHGNTAKSHVETMLSNKRTSLNAISHIFTNMTSGEIEPIFFILLSLIVAFDYKVWGIQNIHKINTSSFSLRWGGGPKKKKKYMTKALSTVVL